MALNMCEMWFNGIKIAFFPKNYKNLLNSRGLCPQTPKASGRWGPCPQTTRLWYVLSCTGFLKTSPKLRIWSFQLYLFKPSIFAKSWLSANRQIFDDVIACDANRQIFDDVIACDLWFRPPQPKILATPINWWLPKKLFWSPFFSFSENTCGCVLGPWPWPRALCPRLHLCQELKNLWSIRV